MSGAEVLVAYNNQDIKDLENFISLEVMIDLFIDRSIRLERENKAAEFIENLPAVKGGSEYAIATLCGICNMSDDKYIGDMAEHVAGIFKSLNENLRDETVLIDAMKKIANQDYRGNMPEAVTIARGAIAEYDKRRS